MTPNFDLYAIWSNWMWLLRETFANPKGLFWWPSLVVAFLGFITIYAWRVSPQPQFQRQLLMKQLPSDIACVLGYSLTQAIIAPVIIPAMVLGSLLFFTATGVPSPLTTPLQTTEMIFIAFLIYLLGDHNIYWTHRFFHKYRFLWAMHKLHHAPPVLTPLTAFRFWPPETIVHMCAFALGEGLAIGIASWVFGLGITPEKFMGVNIFAVTWILVFSHLRHSHIPIRYPRFLSFIFVSPVMHQVHHSIDPLHHDKNYGHAFAIWDWIYGTLYIPEKDERVQFGLKPLNT